MLREKEGNLLDNCSNGLATAKTIETVDTGLTFQVNWMELVTSPSSSKESTDERKFTKHNLLPLTMAHMTWQQYLFSHSHDDHKLMVFDSTSKQFTLKLGMKELGPK